MGWLVPVVASSAVIVVAVVGYRLFYEPRYAGLSPIRIGP